MNNKEWMAAEVVCLKQTLRQASLNNWKHLGSVLTKMKDQEIRLKKVGFTDDDLKPFTEIMEGIEEYKKALDKVIYIFS